MSGERKSSGTEYRVRSEGNQRNRKGTAGNRAREENKTKNGTEREREAWRAGRKPL